MKALWRIVARTFAGILALGYLLAPVALISTTYQPLVASAQSSAAATALTATPTSGVAPLNTSFNGRIYQGNGTLNFGDGSSVTITLPASLAANSVYTFPTQSHTYKNPGTYTAVLTDPDTTARTTITVTKPPTSTGGKPTCQITVNPTSISAGGSVTVKWQSTNATAGAITNIGNVGPSGSINLLPSSNAVTTYFGAFTGPGGTTNCQASVAVSSASGGGGSTGTANATVDPTLTNTPTALGVSAPQAAQGSSGLVPCGYGAFDTNGNNAASSSTGCQACNLAQLIQNVMTFAIGIAIPIAAALFAYAGFLYITSASNPGNIGKAKTIFKDALIGFLIAITAWLIINTLLHVIFSQGAFASGNWFTIQCSNGKARQVNGKITDVLATLPIVAGNTGTIPNTDGGVSAGGGFDANGNPIGGSSGSGGGSGNGTNVLDNAVYNGYDQALSALQSSCDASGDPNSYSCYGLQSMQSAGAVTDSAVEALQNACVNNDQASCVAAVSASPAVGANYDNAMAALQSSCDASGDSNSSSCAGLASLTNAGSITDTAFESLQAACDNGESASCSMLSSALATDAVPGSNTDCSANNIQTAAASGGYTLTDTQASILSCIATPESACGRNTSIPTTPTGQQTSARGMFQITLGYNDTCHSLNIPVCTQAAQAAGYNVSGNLNCSTAFSGGRPNGNTTLANACQAAAANVACNTSAAACLVQANNGSFKDWTADSRSSAQAQCIANGGSR